MTYEAAMNWIEEIQKRGSVPGLGPITKLLGLLDNPQNKLNVIHVAGTNGKGSICAFLEKMYQAEHKTVGRYISPTIKCYLERFQIDGLYMDEITYATLLSQVKTAYEKMEHDGEVLPTAFEIETVIAFLYFVLKKVDVVIMETGMGGRLDATNVVSKPLCTVFASIGMDHMQFLGDSIESIAYEKAGIMRDDCPVISSIADTKVKDILLFEYDKHNLTRDKIRLIDINDIQIVEETLTGSTFIYKGEPYEISLAGTYQIYNAVTAIETKLFLDGRVDKTCLKEVIWEGRFEKICDNPLMIRDGAHNIDGVVALKKSIEKHFTNEHLIFIIGVLRDKEYDKMMQVLCPLASKIYTVTPPVERGLDASKLGAAIRPYCQDVHCCDSILQAVTFAKQDVTKFDEMHEKSVIIAWGSLSYIGQITAK